jgi:hypothetical protein
MTCKHDASAANSSLLIWIVSGPQTQHNSNLRPVVAPEHKHDASAANNSPLFWIVSGPQIQHNSNLRPVVAPEHKHDASAANNSPLFWIVSGPQTQHNPNLRPVVAPEHKRTFTHDASTANNRPLLGLCPGPETQHRSRFTVCCGAGTHRQFLLHVINIVLLYTRLLHMTHRRSTTDRFLGCVQVLGPNTDPVYGLLWRRNT